MKEETIPLWLQGEIVDISTTQNCFVLVLDLQMLSWRAKSNCLQLLCKHKHIFIHAYCYIWKLHVRAISSILPILEMPVQYLKIHNVISKQPPLKSLILLGTTGKLWSSYLSQSVWVQRLGTNCGVFQRHNHPAQCARRLVSWSLLCLIERTPP